MKSYLLLKTNHSSPLGFRRRVQSVQTGMKQHPQNWHDEQAILRRLEQGLEKQLDNEEWQPTQPSVVLPESNHLTIENKLWKYFLGRMELVSGKVEKERLNICQRELMSIKEQVVKRRDINRGRISSLQAVIHSHHQTIHALFEQIKLDRINHEQAQTLLRNKKRRQAETTQATSLPNTAAIKQRIQTIRSQIAKAEETSKHYQGELLKIEEEWKSFLRHFLKEGFYFQQGVTPILSQMVAIEYIPTPEDFPSFLDNTSRQCLLAEYSRLKEQAHNNAKRQLPRAQNVTESRKNMRMLVKKDNLLKIYDGTKSYMMEWLRNEGWKQEAALPRIQSTHSTAHKTTLDWRSEQKRRLNFIQDKERLKKVRAVLFGSKVETIS